MADFDTVTKRASRAMVKALGAPVTFNGSIATHAIDEKRVDIFQVGPGVGELRHIFHLLVEDVGTPSRGDTVMDSDSNTWVLQEQQPGTDQWITQWSATQQ